MSPKEPPRPVFLFTHPRTASNLLMQMLRTHHEIEPIEYPFIDTYYFGEEAMTRRNNERMEAVKQRLQADPTLPQTFQAAFTKLESLIRAAQDTCKTPFIKEHAFTIMKPETLAASLENQCPYMETPQITSRTASQQGTVAANALDENENPTVLPTSFLHGVVPVFLIRHPALVFESILRVSGPTMGALIDDEEFPVDASFRWLRILYDWFVESSLSGTHPLVLNADEIIARPAIVQQLCEQLQLDPEAVRFGWDAMSPATMQKQSSYQQHFFSTIHSSSGVCLDKHSAAQGQTFNLDGVTAKWQETYGAETANALRSFVDAAMPDYEYLCHRELRI